MHIRSTSLLNYILYFGRGKVYLYVGKCNLTQCTILFYLKYDTIINLQFTYYVFMYKYVASFHIWPACYINLHIYFV